MTFFKIFTAGLLFLLAGGIVLETTSLYLTGTVLGLVGFFLLLVAPLINE